jgi:hypothetical protein
MLPTNFWADSAGNILGLFFEALLALVLAPLSALTSGVVAFFAQFMPQ